ncbi:hypothetical protein OIU77_030192 [Salix suchowensis]|uniref:Uncharacterized protein n=1 Tax=Salix suchowensis TaxID=1278906 RepID=A0ABQ9BB28_9ROSI|nr:hypothetical protein OIU77_030192 [Salix suchowensis]
MDGALDTKKERKKHIHRAKHTHPKVGWNYADTRSAEKIIPGIDDSLSLHTQITPDEQLASCRKELNMDIL